MVMSRQSSRSLPRGSRLRVDKLADRVRWLDRYRRVLAVVTAAVASPILIAEVGEEVGAQMHATVLLSVMLGVVLWWTIEVGLVYVTALWETEHYRLTSDRGLPRAILHKFRR
jgi:hypothetical protein